MPELFRKEALERLASSEQLDQLTQLVSPKHWLGLVTFLALAGIALVWAVIGRLPITVTGRGVLMHPRKVVELQAPAAGRLAMLTVSVGDTVRKGAALGVVEQADIDQQLQAERVHLQELLAQDDVKNTLQAQQRTIQRQQIAMEREAIHLQRQDLHKRLRDAEMKAPLLKERLDNRRRLETLGLVPRASDERLQAEQMHLDNQDKIAELTTQLKQLEGQLTQLASKDKHAMLQELEASTSRKNQIQALRSSIALHEGQLARTSQIISEYDGRIVELTVNIGQRVTAGLRLGSLAVEDPGSILVGLTYFPIKAGKKVQPGMQVLIAPDTVERERFGSMLGIITAVSALPVTKEGITHAVGNADVVTTLTAHGPPIEVVAALIPDTSTYSNYRWSSSQGPPLHMTAGTTVQARVVVEQRAPITYLLPFLREHSGLLN
jgi:HlyD family secretion protein